MRTKIEKQNEKRLDEHFCYERERRRKKNKEVTTNDKPSTKYNHALHHEEEGKTMFQMTQRNNIFGHGDTPHAMPKGR
jgi:hypothetical protein